MTRYSIDHPLSRFYTGCRGQASSTPEFDTRTKECLDPAVNPFPVL